MTFELAVDQTSAPQQVANALRESLLKGDIPPGAKLGEARLSEGIGVSRHTLRSAFRILEAEGLLHHSLNRGVIVPELSVDRIADAFRARKALELAGISATDVSGGNESAVSLMRQAVERMSESKGDAELALADVDYHCAVVSACGSQMINDLYRNIQAQLRLTRAWAVRSRGNRQLMVSTHGAVIDRLIAHDRDGASQALTYILELGEQRLLAAMAELADVVPKGAVWPPDVEADQ